MALLQHQQTQQHNSVVQHHHGAWLDAGAGMCSSEASGCAVGAAATGLCMAPPLAAASLGRLDLFGGGDEELLHVHDVESMMCWDDSLPLHMAGAPTALTPATSDGCNTSSSAFPAVGQHGTPDAMHAVLAPLAAAEAAAAAAEAAAIAAAAAATAAGAQQAWALAGQLYGLPASDTHAAAASLPYQLLHGSHQHAPAATAAAAAAECAGPHSWQLAEPAPEPAVADAAMEVSRSASKRSSQTGGDDGVQQSRATRRARRSATGQPASAAPADGGAGSLTGSGTTDNGGGGTGRSGGGKASAGEAYEELARRRHCNRMSQQRMRQLRQREMESLKAQAASWEAERKELVGKLDAMRADHADMLRRMTDITHRWHATVEENARVIKENNAANAKIASLHQQVAALERRLGCGAPQASG